MYKYIGYRDLPRYFNEHNQMGGTPTNSDSRLTTTENDVFLLTFAGANYAITQERAEQFVQEVLSKCTDKHKGFFPRGPEYNGKSTAAVVEIREDNEYFYYDMDDELLLQMLTDLKDECGSPLDHRGLINHCYPNPKLPEGDYDLKSIYHQIYYLPSNRPISVIDNFKPDKKTSRLVFTDDEVKVEIREDSEERTYIVPQSLIPEIKTKVRELCANPVEAFVENGNWESFVYFSEIGASKADKDKRIFTAPDDALALLKDIASKSTLKETKKIENNNNGAIGGAFMGLGMMSMMQQMQAQTQTNTNANTDFCPCCGAPRTAGKFCTECGAEYKNN